MINGGSLTPVTLNMAVSLADNPPGSVAIKIMVSAPFQSGLGRVILTILFVLMLRINESLPEYVQLISSSGLSGSKT